MKLGIANNMVGRAVERRQVLSDIGDVPTAGYSVRKLTAGYTGPCVKVRRSSDQEEKDIGFLGEDLDTTSLLAFVGTGASDDGFVTTWYDQSGSGYHATQATAASQPKIVSAGTLVTENGKVAILPNDGTDYLEASYSGSSTFWLFSTIKVSSSVNSQVLINGDLGGSEYILSSQNGSGVTTISQNSGTPVYFLNGDERTFIDRDDAYEALTSQSLITVQASTSLYDRLIIGYRYVATVNMYKMQELVIYHTDKSSLRTAIEDNINAYFNIY